MADHSDSEPKLAKHIVIDADSIKVDGTEFPWIVRDAIRVIDITGPEGEPEPLYGVVVTIYTDRVDVIAPNNGDIILERPLGQMQGYTTHPTD